MSQDKAIARRVAARFKQAGWWSTSPMGGDAPLDLMGEVENLDPRKAANLIERKLQSRNFTDAYAAMGVWDVVMSSKVEQFKGVFQYLSDEVSAAARKGPPRDDEWSDDAEVAGWLRFYKSGKPSGKIKQRFVPKKLKGPVWYISREDVDERGDDVEIHVTMRNVYTDETKDLDEYLEGPGLEIANLSSSEYGGKGSTQQSIVIEIEGYEGETYDRQVDINSATGEWSDMGAWEGPHE